MTIRRVNGKRYIGICEIYIQLEVVFRGDVLQGSNY